MYARVTGGRKIIYCERNLSDIRGERNFPRKSKSPLRSRRRLGAGKTVSPKADCASIATRDGWRVGGTVYVLRFSPCSRRSVCGARYRHNDVRITSRYGRSHVGGLALFCEPSAIVQGALEIAVTRRATNLPSVKLNVERAEAAVTFHRNIGRTKPRAALLVVRMSIEN